MDREAIKTQWILIITVANGVLIFLLGCFLIPSDSTPVEPIHINGIPSCQEDEIIVGSGDYSGGFWTNYECGHGDD